MRTKLSAAVCFFALALAALTAANAATTWHVATNGINAVGRGTSWDDPLATIHYAYGRASNGDTIVISNGTYYIDDWIWWSKEDLKIIGFNGKDETFFTGIDRFVLQRDTTFRGITFANYTTQPPLTTHGSATFVVRIYDCAFIGNSAGHASALYLYAEDGRVEVYNCVFIDNHTTGATADGGAIRIIEGSVRIESCLLVGNSATRRGGAGWLNSASEVVNCTIISNTAPGMSRGGISGGHVVNSIIYGNTAPSQPNYGGLASITYSITDPLPSGDGNIAADPMLDEDFRPLRGSPAVRAGLYQEWMDDATDLAGNPRVLMGAVDIGAYEYVPIPTLIMAR